MIFYYTADPDKKKKAREILIPVAVTSIIAGVTEPIEFSYTKDPKEAFTDVDFCMAHICVGKLILG